MTGSQQLERIRLTELVPHPANPNVMSETIRAKLRTHIASSGRYPPLVVRPYRDGYQILDGHWRVDVLRELGEEAAACVVWTVDDEEALIAVATLNRLHGEDVPGLRASLLAELAEHETLAELARLLPESEAELEQALGLLDFDVDAFVAQLEAKAQEEHTNRPVLFAFPVEPRDVADVETAIAKAAAELDGPNRKGRALGVLARSYLEGCP